MSQALQSVEGVVRADVRFEDDRATVEARAPACRAGVLDDMNAALSPEGYGAKLRSVR